MIFVIQLLDAAAILNSPGFSFDKKGEFFTVPLVFDELRDLRSRHLAENALQNGLLTLIEPKKETIEKIKALASKKGFTRLSNADVSLLAIALELKKEKKKAVLFTDDYSVQNFCKLLKIKFDSVMRGKIEKTISFAKKCSGCGKKLSNGFSGKTCPDCNSPVLIERQ